MRWDRDRSSGFEVGDGLDRALQRLCHRRIGLPVAKPDLEVCQAPKPTVVTLDQERDRSEITSRDDCTSPLVVRSMTAL